MPSRRNFDPLARSPRPHWLTVADLHGGLIESTPEAPDADLAAAMATALARLAGGGWQAEGGYAYGFVFVRNAAGDRRLVSLTCIAPGEATGTGHAFLAGRGVATTYRAVLECRSVEDRRVALP